MLSKIKSTAASKLLPRRKLDSYKGQNGRVLIVGGCIDFFGAPILAGLGALHSGADLVHLFVSENNFDAVRSHYPDFIVHKYPGNYLSERDADEIVKFGKKKCDSLLIGPGLGEKETTLDAVKEIVKNLHLPTVLDADGIAVLKKIEKFPLPQPIVITPHHNEFRNLVDREITVMESDHKSVILLRSISMDLHINVLLKGPIDFISSEEGHVELNHTGNAGMTVGGTGDVLAGVVASFLARGVEGFNAAKCAAYYCGAAGDLLAKKRGFCFSASDLALNLPYVIPKK